MPPEPPVKRVVVFVDGQNLFHAAREAFGYTYPNYDVLALAQAVCAPKGWALTQTRFYTGIPDPEDDARWHGFWSAKMAVMGRQGVHVFSERARICRSQKPGRSTYPGSQDSVFRLGRFAWRCRPDSLL